jgi:hypothetical protein
VVAFRCEELYEQMAALILAFRVQGLASKTSTLANPKTLNPKRSTPKPCPETRDRETQKP